jgi:hypothetical protein
VATTGTITIAGKSYTWASPRLADLEEFEAAVGPITDVRAVNSVKGRCYLAHLCLRANHPDLVPGVIRTWHSDCWQDLWEMICSCIPMFRPGSPPVPPAAIGQGEDGGEESVAPSTPT